MKTFYASRYKFPTKIVKNGISGVLHVGHKDAKKDIENKLGRQLYENTKIKKRGGNWVFIEPNKDTNASN